MLGSARTACFNIGRKLKINLRCGLCCGGTMKQLWCLFAILAGILFITAPSLAQDSESHPDTGIIYGQQYVNSYFGFSYGFPAGWSGSATRLTMASQVYPLFAASSANSGNRSYIAIQPKPFRHTSTSKTTNNFFTQPTIH